jgi:outer membrane lipoprotein carrier protein
MTLRLVLLLLVTSWPGHLVASARSSAIHAPCHDVTMSRCHDASIQSSVDSVIDKAVAAYAKLRTATGSFEQTITNPLTGTTVSSKGDFQQATHPARFAFVFIDPKGDRIVGDGKSLWIYTPSSTPGQVLRLGMGDANAGNFDLAAEFFTEPRARYTIGDAGAATVGGRPTRALTLVPRSSSRVFTRAKVWIDVEDGSLRQFETVEESGLKRFVTVTRLSVNAPVNESLFRFTPPKGVKVFDQGSARASD